MMDQDAQLGPRRHFNCSNVMPGEATVCVLAVTNDDAKQWCKEITLEQP